jgi:hypothetical protein
MKKAKDFDKLSEGDLDHIKSLALSKYKTTSGSWQKEVFNVECFVYGFLCFLNANGYEIKPKEDNDEQQIQSKKSNKV